MGLWKKSELVLGWEVKDEQPKKKKKNMAGKLGKGLNLTQIKQVWHYISNCWVGWWVMEIYYMILFLLVLGICEILYNKKFKNKSIQRYIIAYVVRKH